MSVEVSIDAEADINGAPAVSVHRAGWWAGKGTWAILDQGLFATSNFILTILLARWLPPEQFGSFAVAHAAFLLAGTLHAGILIEPMLVFGSARHARRFGGYLNVLLYGHWRLAACGSLLLAMVALVLWSLALGSLAVAFLGAAVATPFVLFGWLVRRASFARLQPRWAAGGGAFYLLIVLTGSFFLHHFELLSTFMAFLLMGGAGLLSGRWILRRLRAASLERVEDGPSRDDVIRDHWRYGRWSIASSGLSWIPGNLYYVLLPVFAGLEAAAALKALSNLVLPVLHFNGALATLLLPVLAAAARERSRFNGLVVAGLTAFVTGSLTYGALLTAYRAPIVEWVYQGAYSDAVSLVPVLSLLPLAAAGIAVLGSALRALERPQLVFWSYVGSAAITVTVGVGLTAHWGASGAAGGLLLSSAVTAIACGVLFLAAQGRISSGALARSTS